MSRCWSYWRWYWWVHRHWRVRRLRFFVPIRHRDQVVPRGSFVIIHGEWFKMAVTSINLVEGATTPVHVTVADQDGTALDPAQVTWDLSAAAGVTQAPDATGFNFSAAAGSAAGTFSARATYSGPRAPASVSGDLGVVLEITVTALTFESP